MTEDIVWDVCTGQSAEVEVLFQQQVQMDVDVSLFYIKSGEDDIRIYVEETIKPDIAVYVDDQKKIVDEAAQSGVTAVEKAETAARNNLTVYTEDSIKPSLDAYVETVLKPDFQSFAADETEAFDVNAAAKTALVDLAAENAESSKNEAVLQAEAASVSATAAAKSSDAAASSAEDARLWAVGELAEQPAGSAQYWANSINPQTLVPVGLIVPFGGSKVPEGWLSCNGAAVSRETYSALFEVIGTLYGSGNGSTTFNLPNFTGKTFWGATSGWGGALASGLPNISGNVTYSKHITSPSASGAFSRTTASEVWGGTGAGSITRVNVISFDASRSNAIYGKSSVVQPPAVKTMVCIKY